MEKQDIFIIVGQALFAVFGSCVAWLHRKDTEQRTLFRLLSEAVSAGFSGILVYLVYMYFHFDTYFAFGLAGIVGYSGIRGLVMLEKLLFFRLAVHAGHGPTTAHGEPPPVKVEYKMPELYVAPEPEKKEEPKKDEPKKEEPKEEEPPPKEVVTDFHAKFMADFEEFKRKRGLSQRKEPFTK